MVPLLSLLENFTFSQNKKIVLILGVAFDVLTEALACENVTFASARTLFAAPTPLNDIF